MVTPVLRPLLVLAAILMVVGAFAPNAGAQVAECERVPYNERIIVVCTSTGSNDGEMPDPADDLSEPAQRPTQADEPDATGSSAGGESDGADRPDRGDRGGRSGGADVALGDGQADDGGDVFGSVELDSDSAQEQAGDESGDSEAPVDTDDGLSSSSDDDSDSDDSDSDDGAGHGSRLLAIDPEPDNLPVIAAVGALTAAGAVLFLAAHRKKRDR
jgi:hypothetical protein